MIKRLLDPTCWSEGWALLAAWDAEPAPTF